MFILQKIQLHRNILVDGPCNPFKCFSAPCHQILAKSAPQKARNRDKAEFVTKVRRSS